MGLMRGELEMNIFEAVKAAQGGAWIRNVDKWGENDRAIARTDTHDKENGSRQLLICHIHTNNGTMPSYYCRPLRIDEINPDDAWEIVGETKL